MPSPLLPTVGIQSDGGSRKQTTDMRLRAFTPNQNIAFSVKPSDNLKYAKEAADTISKYAQAIQAEKERALVNEAIGMYQEDLASIETDYYNKKLDNAVYGFDDYQKSIKALEQKYGKVFNRGNMQGALNDKISDYALQARVNGRNHHDKEVQAKSLKELEGRVDKSVEHFFTQVGGPFDKQNHAEMVANVRAYLAEQGYSDPNSEAYQLESKKIFDKAFYGPIRSLISRDPHRALVYLDKLKDDISQIGYAQFYEIAQDRIETLSIRAAQRAEIAEARKAREDAKRTAESEKELKKRLSPLEAKDIAEIFQKHKEKVIREFEEEELHQYRPDNKTDYWTVYSRAYGRTLKEVADTNQERKAYQSQDNMATAFIISTYDQKKAIGQGGIFKKDPYSQFTAEERAIIRGLYPNSTVDQINESINKTLNERETDSTYAYEKNILQMSESELLELDPNTVYQNVSGAFVPVFNEKIEKARQNAAEGKIQNGNSDINNLIYSEGFGKDVKDKNKVENLFYKNMANDIQSDMIREMRYEATDKNGNVDISKLSPQRQQSYWYSYKSRPEIQQRIEAIKNFDKMINNTWENHKAELSVNRDEVMAKGDMGKVASDLYYKNNHVVPSEYQLVQELKRLDEEKILKYRDDKRSGVPTVTNIRQLKLFFTDPIWNNPSYENELYWEADPVIRAKSYAPENQLSGNSSGEWRFRED
jgi:hypothetical protein